MFDLGKLIGTGMGYVGAGLEAVLEPTMGVFGKQVVFPAMGAVNCLIEGGAVAAPVVAAPVVAAEVAAGTWLAYATANLAVICIGAGSIIVIGGIAYYSFNQFKGSVDNKAIPNGLQCEQKQPEERRDDAVSLLLEYAIEQMEENKTQTAAQDEAIRGLTKTQCVLFKTQEDQQGDIQDLRARFDMLEVRK